MNAPVPEMIPATEDATAEALLGSLKGIAAAERRKLGRNPVSGFVDERAAGPQRYRAWAIAWTIGCHLSRSRFRVARSVRIALASAS